MTEVLREFIDKYGVTLDEVQAEAAFSGSGKRLLLAVPGSGKTSVIIARLGYLTKVKEVLPSEILALTYSVAAANEMKVRYVKKFGRDDTEIRTIHAFCLSVINEYSRIKKTHAFRPMSDEENVKSVIRRIMSQNGGYPTESDINEAITKLSYCENMMLDDDTIKKEISLPERDFSEIRQAYKSYKLENGLMDFDDMLKYAYTILLTRKDVLKATTFGYKHILVDEAQDTSKLQHLIIRKVAEHCGNIFMVGDEDQSIYGFRAAYPEGLTEFDRIYPDAAVSFMEKNYRSTKNVVSAAAQIISANTERKPKKMTTDREDGEQIKIKTLDDLSKLPDYICERASDGRQTAVLTRLNDSLLPICDALDRDGIKFTIRGRDLLFFTHYTVTDIKNFFAFASNPFNEELFMKLYYKFSCGISKKEAEYAVSRHGNENILSFLANKPDISVGKRSRIRGIKSAVSLIKNFDSYEAIKQIINNCGYGDYLFERPNDMSKIYALLGIARNHRNKEEFFSHLSELEDIIKNGKNEGSVILSTIHSAKGMEFDRVIVADAYNGTLPSVFGREAALAGDQTKKTAEEERRIFYVGITRAINELELIKYKSLYGTPPEGQDFVDEVEKIVKGVSLSNAIKEGKAIKKDDRVRHGSYGDGTVVSNDGQTITISFDKGGKRKFVLTMVIQNGVVKKI